MGRQGAAEAVVDAADLEGDADRPMRADARRNYEAIVAAARQVFAEEGGGASLEAVARRGGVGIGTLYRHFPRRIDLVEAVYRTDVDQVVATAETAVSELDPWAAVEAFIAAFVRYALSKRNFLNELHEAFEKNPDLKLQSRQRLDAAMQLVIDRAQRAGVVRSDVTGSDVMQLLGPMCMSATLSAEQSARLVPMILDGLRPSARSIAQD
ncbi:MAG: helix-turn-helix domain-containing protein [Acidimicrobiales bacterium]